MADHRPHRRPGRPRQHGHRDPRQLADRQVDLEQATHAVGSGTLLVRSEEGQFAFVHQSVLEWLVARHAVEAIGVGDQSPEVLGARTMSPLMADFFRGLLGRDAARDWATGVLAAPSSADTVKSNALLVLDRLGEKPLADSQLAGQDLRGASLSGRDFRRADLHDADLSDAWLSGTNVAGANLSGAKLRKANLNEANLTGADLTGARLLGADLTGASMTGSLWRRAALIGAQLEESAFAALDTLGAALPGMDAEPQLSLSLGGTSLAFGPDSGLLAVASNDGTVRLWDLRQGTWLATLIPLTEGWAVLTPDGRYKLEGQAGGELWWVAGLCRFEPGELDPYIPSIRRLPADAPLFPPST